MTIDRNSWHARVFIWWWEYKYGKGSFKFHQSVWGKQTNLCSYCRAVMFWAPLGFVTMRCWFVFWPIVAGILNTLAIRKWGRVFWINEIKVIAGLTAYLALIAGVFMLWGYLQKRFKALRTKRQEHRESLPDSGPSFFELLRTKVQAAHAKVCPLVEIG